MSCKTIKYAAVFVAGALSLAAGAAIPAAGPVQAAPVPPNTAAITAAVPAPIRHVYYRRGYYGRGYYGGANTAGTIMAGATTAGASMAEAIIMAAPFTAAPMLTPMGPMVIPTATPTLILIPTPVLTLALV
jgi:hypothetical protein